jgi:hypothetical protein
VNSPADFVPLLFALGIVAILAFILLVAPRLDRARLDRAGERLFGAGRYRLDEKRARGFLVSTMLVGQRPGGEIRLLDWPGQKLDSGATVAFVPADDVPTVVLLPRAQVSFGLVRSPSLRAIPLGRADLDEAYLALSEEAPIAASFLWREETRRGLETLVPVRSLAVIETGSDTGTRFLRARPADAGLGGALGVQLHGPLGSHARSDVARVLDALDHFRAGRGRNEVAT